MAIAVYLLSAGTSLACALLLWRSYRTSHISLLFWSTLFFFGLTIENTMLFFDLVVYPHVDLEQVRNGVGLLSWTLLLFGLVWESDR
jgi:hypothetical protein